MTKTIALLLLLGPLVASAQIYKTTDSEGNVSYTDQPPAGSSASEKIELRRLNTTPPPPDQPRPAATTEQAAAAEPAVSITEPAPETTIPMGPGDFTVTARAEPPLSGGEMLQLQMDGSNIGAPQAQGAWALSNIFRGAHELTVSRVNRDGKEIARSTTITVYVMRPSIK